MSNLTFVIRKEPLTEDQITLIRMYKTYLLPADSSVEEYTMGFKFFIDPFINFDNIKIFFNGYGINTEDGAYFKDIWEY